jgi:hypothetical protein
VLEQFQGARVQLAALVLIQAVGPLGCLGELGHLLRVVELFQCVAEAAPRLQAEQAQELVALDAEDLVLLGVGAVGHDVEQPLDGRLALAVGVGERLLAADDHELVAGQRVDRLDAAAVLHGQLGKLV